MDLYAMCSTAIPSKSSSQLITNKSTYLHDFHIKFETPRRLKSIHNINNYLKNGNLKKKFEINALKSVAPSEKLAMAKMSHHVIEDVNSIKRNATLVEEKTKKRVCPEYHPSHGWQWMPHHLSKEELWLRIREEAKEDAASEPLLASVLHSSILVHNSFEKTMAFILSNKLASSTLLGTHLMRLIKDAYANDPFIINACSADLQSVYDRDPACDKYTQCMMYFKGFMAIQSHRIAHWLWKKGRKALAEALQSRVSEVFHVDIHPGATFGRGIFMDHATGVVIGETAVIGDNVSLLHQVTLGGSGMGKGKRHPTIGHGVLIGAGANIIGPIHVGRGSKIGAGTVVIKDLPCYCVAVGVPSRIVKQDSGCEPCSDMDQCHDFIPDFQI